MKFVLTYISIMNLQAPLQATKDTIHINLNPRSKNKSNKRKAGPNAGANKKGANKKGKTGPKSSKKGKGTTKKAGPKANKANKNKNKRYLLMSIWTEISLS